VTTTGVQLLRKVVLGLAASWVLLLVVVFAWRIGFALELEWMEGGLLHQALRLQRGQPIYPEPGPEFVPFLYTPGYAVILAGLGAVFPLGFALGRAVSVVAWMAIGAGLWRAVGFELKPMAHRAAAVGLWCSAYVFTFRWMDVARPDTLYLAFTLWGLVLLREARGDHKKAILAGLLVALGFWTKQTAALFVVASGIAALVVAPRQLWSYALTIAVVAGGGVVLVDSLTDGWLWTYVYELHQTHAFNEERFRKKTWGMFLHAAPFVAVLLTISMLERLRPWLPAFGRGRKGRMRERWRHDRGFVYWGVLAFAGLIVSALGYSTQWAEPNAFMPGACFGALFVAVSLPVGGRKEGLGLGLVASQLVFAAAVEPMYQPIQDQGLSALSKSYAWQRPSRTLPSSAARAHAARLRAELEDTPGEVLALHRPWWSVLAGGPGHVGSMGIRDVPPTEQRRIVTAIADDLADGRYASVWLEGEPPAWMIHALGAYRVQRRLQDDARVRPMSGWMSRAGVVTAYRADQVQWGPPRSRPRPEGVRVLADFEDGTLQGFRVEGAFPRRPTTGTHGRLPAVGPIGGSRVLSSAGAHGRLDLTGRAISGAFTLPAGGSLELLVGRGGRGDGLALEVVVDGDGSRHEIPVPATRFVLVPVSWSIPPELAGAQVRLHIVDEASRAAVFVDDIWVVDAKRPA
jgi:hypothetical protein